MKKILVGILLLSLWLQPVLPLLETRAWAQNPSPTLPLTHHGGQAGQGDTGQDQQKTVKTIQPSSTSLFSDPLDYVKGYRKKVAQQNFKAYFKEKKSETDYLSYRYGANWLNLSPTFSNKFTVNYETSENQIKEKIVVSNPSLTLPLTGQGNTSFTSTFTKNSDLKIKVEGKVWDETTAIATSKRIEFIDKDNKTLFYWEPLVYYDSSPTAESVVGKTQLNKSKSGNGFLVTLYVPTSWLTDSTRVYPLIIDPTFTDANSKTLDTQSNWWNSAYALNKQLTVINSSTSSLSAGTVVTQTIDTKALYDAGNIQNDCDDLRITYGTTTQTELTRALVFPSGQSCSTSTATQVSFALQAAIAAGSSDNNYYLYYKNPAAAGPTNTQQAFNIGSTQATLVLPFNGTTTAVGTGVTPTTATGAIRYSTNSAMSFDGKTQYVDLGNKSDLNFDYNQAFSISFWVNSSSFNANKVFISKRDNSYKGYWFGSLSGGYIEFQQTNTLVTNTRRVSWNTPSTNTWVHIMLTSNGVNASGYKLYYNGLLQTPRGITSDNLSSSIVGTNSTRIGVDSFQLASLYSGMMDEFSVYNRVLSQAEVTSLYNSGAGRVVQCDANTKLILHFDENGSDPRSTNTAFDDSGNGNNGTIYGNAKYVSGLVGVDPSASSGQVPAASFASHQGVFIEEGTVNRIKNPSFESNVTDSWVAKPNINFTTAQTDTDGNALVGSNTIKDVFFYDTTKDSDGGAWRNNATAIASSWYSEAFSTTRGRKKEFPEKAYIVGEDTTVDIIDAVENKLWMRFTKTYVGAYAGSMLNGGESSTSRSVYALNGRIYITNNGGSGSTLTQADFKADTGYITTDATQGTRRRYTGLSLRNSTGQGVTDATIPYLVNKATNDVSVAVISGKTYVAVATDGGVSVINETDGTVANSADTSAFGNIFVANNSLYYSGKSSRFLAVRYSISTQSTGFANSGYYSQSAASWSIDGPRLAADTTTGIGVRYVTVGTSTVDGTSNTIYYSSPNGLNVIQEKQGDETHGSVKYYDKNHITEEMIGAIKGQWGLWETTSTDANQFKASGYLDTGKLGQAVSMYGPSTGSGQGSTLTFNRGQQISGNNYEHINTNQGTISFWFKPSFNGSDNLEHYLFTNRIGGTWLSVYTKNNVTYLELRDGTTSLTPSVALTITSGNWYQVTARWSINKVDGTNYADIRVNNGTAGVTSTAFTTFTPPTTLMIGSYLLGVSPAQALIDDFAIFDRVLSTSEITSLYNSGTGNEAGYVADSSLKFYAKMDGSGTLQPVTYNGGASASKMTRTSSELTGGTNLVTDGNMEAAGTANWAGGATLSKSTSTVFADTQSMSAVMSVNGQGLKPATNLSLTGGNTYNLSFWYRGTTSTANIFETFLWDYTTSGVIPGNNTLLTLDDTWRNITFTFKVSGSGTHTVGAWPVYQNGSDTTATTIYVDNYLIVPNLVDNGGMEGQYTPTGSAKYHATTAQVRSGSGPYVYTETGKFATGLAGLIATDGADFGYITTSDANSITVDFTGGSGVIPTNAALDVVSAVAPSMSSSGTAFRSTTSHSGTYSQGLTRITTMPYVVSNGILTGNYLVTGNTYLLTFWARANTNGTVVRVTDGNGGANNGRPDTSFTLVSADTWYKFSIVWKATSTWNYVLLGAFTNNTTVYFDDVSVTPLDNVATSFKSWASVSDSSALGNSLSVQGSATGVSSLAAGVRNSAYTFDGSTGYLRQATIATNIGTLGYSGNTLADDGQTFTSYKTSSGNAAYMIVVTNSDNTTSWGYIGNNSEAATAVTVYTTIARTTQGWNGTAVSGKTPVGYEIRKTDFQITGNFTVGAWIKTNGVTGVNRFIMSKAKDDIYNFGWVNGFNLNVSYIAGYPEFVISDGSAPKKIQATTNVNDNIWHQIVASYDYGAGVITLYVDGVVGASLSGISVSSYPTNNQYPLEVGRDINDGGTPSRFFSGSIDEPFVTAEALTAAQILDMYNKGLGALNHATKSDQKLQGSTNTVQAVAASSDGTYIYAGTDTALTVFKNGKTGNYTDSDSAVTSFTTATTPALVSNNSVALDLVGNSTSTTPSLIVGSSASGVSGINLVRGVPALDSSVYRFGSKALLLDNTNSVLDTPLVMQDTQTSAPYTLSFYAYSTGTTLTKADIVPIALNSPITTATYEDVGGGWNRIQVTYNSDTGTSRAFGVQVKAGKKIYVDGVQIEQKSYPTSYADGSLGTGYSWTTANNSVTTRTATDLRYSATNNFSANTGTVSLWFKSDTTTGTGYYFQHWLAPGNRIYISRGSGNILWAGLGDSGALPNTNISFALGKWNNAVLSWNNGTYGWWVNGVGVTGTYTNLNAIGTYYMLGNNGANWANSAISDLRLYDSAIGASQVVDLYQAGLASHSEGTSVAVWQPTKTFESATIDASDITNWNTLSWSQNLPGGVGGNPVRFQFAVKASDDNWSASDFVGSDCTSSSYWSDSASPYSVNLSSCNALAPDDSSGKRYARYRIYLATADQTVAPTVSNVTVDYELIKPKAPSNLNGSSTSSTAITWNWTDNSVDEAGFKVLDSDGNVKCNVASSNVTTCTETELAPNQSYSRKVIAWNSRGSSTSSDQVSVVTLSTAPTSTNIISSRSTATWYNSPLFSFTNSMGGGWNEVSTLKYVWNQTKNYSWSSGESSWTSGTLSVNATADSNSYYLHLKGFNSEGTANGSVDLGPYYYQSGSPEAGTLTINNGAEYSNKRAVTLGLNGNDSGSGISQMMLSEDSNFSGATWQNYATTTAFTLSAGDGTKTVYTKFKNGAGNESGTTSDSIILDATTPTAGELTTPENNSYTNSHRPNFSWKAASDNLSGVDHYLLELSGQGDDEKVETKSTFATLQTDLTEGQKTWTITVVDKAGNTTSNSRTFYVDFAGPTVSNLSFDNTKIEGKADGYQVSSTIEPTVLGNISDNYAADKVEIAYYLQNFLLGIESSRSLQLVETNNLDNGTTQSGFSFRANQPLSFGKYAVIVTGIDKAGNRSEEKTLYLWLLTPVQAKTVVNKNSNVETRDRASLPKNETAPVVISLPNLEKQATLKREKEANELAKFTNSINDTLAFMGGTLNKTTQAISQWTKEETSSWLAWIMAQNKTINKTIATSSKRAEKEASKSIAEGVTNLIGSLTSVSRGYQQLQLSLTAAARQIIAVSPEVVRQITATVIVRPFEKVNKNLANSAQKINWQVKESQSNSQRQINNLAVNILELAMATVNGGQKIVGDGAQLVGKTAMVIGSKLAIPFQLSRTAMGQMGKQISLTTQSRLNQAGKGMETAGHFISDPAVKTGNFALRIVKGVQIFVAYVFGTNDPTQIDQVALAEVGKDYAIVTWETNHYTHNNKVNYGTSTSYGQSAWGENETKKHTVKITNLKPGQKYYFEVMSQNGNYAYDAFYTFETEK